MRNISRIISGGGTGTTVTQITSTFDTRGFSYATISVFGIASTVAPSSAASNHVLEESDNSTASFTTVSGSTPSPISSTAAIATTIAKMVYNVDLRGRKRYLKVTYSSNSGDALLVTCDLSNASDGIVSASEQGSAAGATV
jgi:hypothetical protein